MNDADLYVGIDGGQSATVAVIGDARATLARGSGPPADLVGEARTSERQRAAIVRAYEAALEAAELPRDTRVRALVAGISGFDDGLSRAPDLSAIAETSAVVHDATIAHAGALGGEPGIVVIAGTGSVALGNATPGTYRRAGGWGYFFGDEGSAIWIARTAIRRAMAREDAGEDAALARRAREAFGVASLRALQHAFAHGELTRPALAGFAAIVLAEAASGDPDAVATRREAAGALADLCATIDARLDAASRRSVSYAGGLFADAAFVASFAAAVTGALPHARIAAPVGDAASGALVLARGLVD